LIVEAGRPVGYLCWQHPSRAELVEAGLHEVPDSAIAVDLMIGEPDAVGRGIGPRALERVRELAWRDPGVPFVMLCTSIENSAAQRAFHKAGFARRRVFDDPGGGPCCLFVAERPRGIVSG
jgi:aminoglycoside 6'-N-acetyltransferase